MTALSARLPEKVRLKNLGFIQYLFSEANEKVGKYPLLLFYGFNASAEERGVKVMFSVSKKKYPRAVDRNRIKRLMREAYRVKGFENLVADKTEQLLLAFVYTGKTITPLMDIKKSIDSIYDVLTERVS